MREVGLASIAMRGRLKVLQRSTPSSLYLAKLSPRLIPLNSLATMYKPASHAFGTKCFFV
jgi:hypothetical protein